MHLNNLEYLLPELNFPVLLLIGVFLYATVVVSINYFKAVSAVYKGSVHAAGKIVGFLSKCAAVFWLLMPVLLVLTAIFMPYGYSVYNGEATITAYSGGKVARIPEKIFFWDVTEIGEDAFRDHQKLQEVIIPDSVTAIRENAFANNTNLEKVTYSEDLGLICHFAFADCKKLTQITTPCENTYIQTGAFLNTPWLYSRQGDYVILGDQHYIYLGNEEAVQVPDGIKTVDFYLNETVTRIELPETITGYPEYCFQGCSNLYGMNVVGDVRWQSYCFGGCDHLSSVQSANLVMRGSILARDVDRPFEVDQQLKESMKSN